MTVTDLASDIWRDDLDEDTGTSIPAIAQWLRTHIGDLNNKINNGYYINDSFEIIDENGAAIDVDAASIYKTLYEINYFKKQSKAYLGAGGVDAVTQVTQDGITIRGVERNGIAKTYLDLLKEAKNTLTSLVNNYKYNRSRGSQVVGDDILTKNTPVEVDPTNNATISS
jgi:hypothetical protein